MTTNDPRIFKTAIFFETGPSITRVDTIEVDGRLWLVPMWLESPSEGWTKPARIIALEPFRPRRMGAQYVAQHPVPKALFDDPIPPELRAQYTVVEAPDIFFPYLV